MRRQEAERMERREQERQREHSIAHARTLEARSLDARLDALELAEDKWEQVANRRAHSPPCLLTHRHEGSLRVRAG
eukprot:814371-Prymnesium_polylepis.1